MRAVNDDYQAFEFTTNAQRRLALYGGLLSWQDEIKPGLVRHQILKRRGAIHQNVGSQPRMFAFKCTLIGTPADLGRSALSGSVGDRWRILEAAIDEDPTGLLIHPRFGKVNVVCLGVQGTEDPGESTDEVLYTIRFEETGLRTEPRQGAGTIAGAALSSPRYSMSPSLR